MGKPSRIKDIRTIEVHLRNYNTYKIGIKTLQNQLNYIMPNVTANYEVSEGSTGTFNISSSTENYAIDRIESMKALVIYEDIERYKVIVDSINQSIEGLDDTEKLFVEVRYIQGKTILQTSSKLGYSEKHIFNIRNQALNKLLLSLKGLVQF